MTKLSYNLKKINANHNNTAMVIISVLLAVVICLSIALVSYYFGSQSSANTEHIYHANMISKSFTQSEWNNSTNGELRTVHHEADNFVDHVGNIRDYKVHISYNFDKNGLGHEVENVTLVRRHETPYQKAMLKYEKKINNDSKPQE